MDNRLADEAHIAKEMETMLGIRLDQEKQMNLDIATRRAIENDRDAGNFAPAPTFDNSVHVDDAQSYDMQE